jgi:hypothetical protein
MSSGWPKSNAEARAGGGDVAWSSRRRRSTSSTNGGSRSTLQMRLGAVCIVICGCVAAVAAQGSAVSQGGGEAAGTAKAAEQITVTGCLQRTEAASTPATGTAGAPQLPPGFVLINAKSATAESQPADVTTYVLEGVDLASSVGQRVEVKGTLTPATIGTSGTTSPAERHEAGSVTSETPGSASATSTADSPRIRVASVRVVGDCSSSQ